MQRDQS